MPKKKERMASYIRESDPGLADSTTIESQAKACREHGQKKGYNFNIQSHEYKEAMSGYTVSYTQRPALLRMLEAAKRHEFDVLVVSEIRALGRKQVEIFVLYDQLQKYGIRLETISEQFEDSAMGRLILSLRAAFSEIEHDQILLRLERGRKDRVEIGQAINGHGQAGYGHVFVDSLREPKATYALDTKVVFIDENNTEWTPVSVIRFMRDLALQGYGCSRIGRTLTAMGIPNPDYGKTRKGKPFANIWYRATVYRILTDPRITGVVYANKYQYVNKKQIAPSRQQVRLPDCPPIISIEEFAKIGKQLQINREDSPRNNAKGHAEMGLFRAGFCRCGICHRSMTIHHHGSERLDKPSYPDYICRKKTGSSDLLNSHHTSLSMRQLDREGWKHAIEVILNPSLVRERVSLLRQENSVTINRDSVEATIAAIQQQIHNLFSLAQQASDDDSIAKLAQTLNDLERQKREAQAILYDVEEEEEETANLEAEIVKFEQWAEQVRPLLANPDYVPTYEEKRLAVRILGLRCTVFPKGDYPFRYQFELAPPEIIKMMRLHCVSLDRPPGRRLEAQRG